VIRLDRTFAILLRQLYLLRGSPARLLPLFAWAAIDIVLWGFITRWLDAVTARPVAFVPVLLGAVLFWDFFGRVMQGVTTAFFEDVWSRNFLNVFATPLTIAEYVAGLVLASVVTSAIGLAVMVALATFGFGLSFAVPAPMLFAFLLVLFLFGIALGIVGCAVVLRLGPAAEWLIWPIPALLSPFAGVFYPLSVLPGWMQAIGRALPPSYVFESLRAVVAGGTGSWRDLAWGLGLALLEIVVAAWIFVRVHRHALRTGLIARYSAETVG
jgi:ABC-2 type transport system permease protein